MSENIDWDDFLDSDQSCEPDTSGSEDSGSEDIEIDVEE